MRLNRFLSECGVTSRRKADNLIKAGRITINGEVVRTLGSVVDESQDAVSLDGKPLRKERKRYVMLNKPPFYLTSLKSLEDGKKTITSFLGDIEQRFTQSEDLTMTPRDCCCSQTTGNSQTEYITRATMW